MKISANIILSLATLLYLFLVYQFWFVCDDAYISFRYSKNLADGFGLTYNINGQLPVEGYTNFLVVLLGAGVEYLGFKIDFWIPFFSTLCGLGLLRALYLFLLELGYSKNQAAFGYLLLAIFPPFFIWSSSGMEAIAMSFFLFQAFRYLIFKNLPYHASFYAILLSLIRAEGICWALIILGLSITKFNLKTAIRYLIPLLLVFGTYFVWRYNYFQELLPNTVTNKVGSDFSTLERGAKYALQYFLVFLFPILIFPANYCILKQLGWRWGWSIITLVDGLLLYPIVVGGDFMTMFRFYTPLFPFQVIFIISILKYLTDLKLSAFRNVLGLIVISLSLLPADNIHIIPTEWRSQFHIRLNTEKFRSEYEQWQFMKSNSDRWQALGRALREISNPGDTLVAGAIGNLGYFSGLTIYDRFGLVEPRVAKRQVRNLESKSPGHDKAVPAEFFLSDRPTFLKAYILVGDRNQDANQRIKAFSKKKIYQDYEPLYIPLEKKLAGKDLGLLVLKRKADEEN